MSSVASLRFARFLNRRSPPRAPARALAVSCWRLVHELRALRATVQPVHLERNPAGPAPLSSRPPASTQDTAARALRSPQEATIRLRPYQSPTLQTASLPARPHAASSASTTPQRQWRFPHSEHFGVWNLSGSIPKCVLKSKIGSISEKGLKSGTHVPHSPCKHYERTTEHGNY
jgi:hypothetical protein